VLGVAIVFIVLLLLADAQSYRDDPDQSWPDEPPIFMD
jgi:hypothetical protein